MNDHTDTISRARRNAMESTERLAERRMADTRWDWLRPLGRRRTLVAVWAASVVIGGLITALGEPFSTLGVMAVGAGLVWVLRLVVRAVVDLPDEVLDERLESARDRSYRLAYMTLVSLLMVVLLVMYIAWDGERIAYEAQPAHLHGLFYAVLFGGLGLPSAVYAWTQREV